MCCERIKIFLLLKLIQVVIWWILYTNQSTLFYFGFFEFTSFLKPRCWLGHYLCIPEPGRLGCVISKQIGVNGDTYPSVAISQKVTKNLPVSFYSPTPEFNHYQIIWLRITDEVWISEIVAVRPGLEPQFSCSAIPSLTTHHSCFQNVRSLHPVKVWLQCLLSWTNAYTHSFSLIFQTHSHVCQVWSSPVFF